MYIIIIYYYIIYIVLITLILYNIYYIYNLLRQICTEFVGLELCADQPGLKPEVIFLPQPPKHQSYSCVAPHPGSQWKRLMQE